MEIHPAHLRRAGGSGEEKETVNREALIVSFQIGCSQCARVEGRRRELLEVQIATYRKEVVHLLPQTDFLLQRVVELFADRPEGNVFAQLLLDKR